MHEIGLLWQTDTISPAHEHFITYLIKQKLLINTEKLQLLEPTKDDKVFVLFLPMNEIHELGLMYLNYEILLNGYKTIYLGESVPTESLKDIKKYFSEVIYVSYVTVQPDKNVINDYVSDINKVILDDNSKIWFIGRMTEYIEQKSITSKVSVFNSILDLVNEL